MNQCDQCGKSVDYPLLRQILADNFVCVECYDPKKD